METDDWKGLVAQGIEARKQVDGGRWRLGDLACEVAGHSKLDRASNYGDNALERYAQEVGVEYYTLAQYRQVAERFCRRLQNLSYSHHHAVVTLVRWDGEEWDATDALSLLEQAEREHWSVARLREEAQRGHTPPLGHKEGMAWFAAFLLAVERTGEEYERDPIEIAFWVIQNCSRRRAGSLLGGMRTARATLANIAARLHDDRLVRECVNCKGPSPIGTLLCERCFREAGIEYEFE